jgi:hypothetical protein
VNRVSTRLVNNIAYHTKRDPDNERDREQHCGHDHVSEHEEYHLPGLAQKELKVVNKNAMICVIGPVSIPCVL